LRGDKCEAARTLWIYACKARKRDEKKDIPPFYEKLIRKVKAPVMIDTTDATAIELALTYCQGKAILNSIIWKMAKKVRARGSIAHEFGAAVVVGCIDEDKLQAQAFTRERKLAIAQRSFKLLTEKYGPEVGGHHFRSAGFSVCDGR